MAVEGDLQALLEPLSNGCFPLIAPDGQAHPYITYQVIDNPILNTLDGDAGISNRRIQIDAWADTYEAAKTLSRAITDAMKGASFVNLKLNEGDGYEEETKTFRQRMDFSVWGEP